MASSFIVPNLSSQTLPQVDLQWFKNLKFFKNFENRARFSFDISKTEWAMNLLKLIKKDMFYQYLKMNIFVTCGSKNMIFSTNISIDMNIIHKKMVSLAFFALKILTFFNLTWVTTSIFSGFFHEIMKNHATDFP